MAQGCKLEESVIGSFYFLEKRRVNKVHDYEMKKSLENNFLKIILMINVKKF